MFNPSDLAEIIIRVDKLVTMNERYRKELMRLQDEEITDSVVKERVASLLLEGEYNNG